VIRGLWMLILEPCMDGFKYRHLASTPTEAHPILQDMLLYIAVLDRCVFCDGRSGAGTCDLVVTAGWLCHVCDVCP
jgi:hypothetical protein